jgi:diaminopimelate epimerase
MAVDLEIGVVSMGNPHAILQVDDVDQAPVAHIWGRCWNGTAAFPSAQCWFHADRRPGSYPPAGLRAWRWRNAGLRQRRLRGGGGGPAVGSPGPKVRVELPGGELSVHWAGEGESVIMTGPAATAVFEGWIEL